MSHIYICDDDEPVLDAISLLLQSVGYQVTAFSRATQLLQALAKAPRPDCIVADVRMPEMDGIQLHDALSEQQPGLPVIIITGHADVPMAVERMKAGAADFLSKPFRDQELLDAISRCLSAATNNNTATQSKRDWETAKATLTQREREVLAGLAEGKANKVLAHEMGISVRTLEVHRAHIYQKMGVKTNTELLLKMPR